MKFIVLLILFALISDSAHATVLLIQDFWGGVNGIVVSDAPDSQTVASVRKQAGFASSSTVIDLELTSSGAYQLTQAGQLIELGGAPRLQAVPASAGSARAFSADEPAGGGWIADGDYITIAGRPRTFAFPTLLHQDTRIMDIDFIPEPGWILLAMEDGRIAICGPDIVVAEFSLDVSDKDTLIDAALQDDQLWCLTSQGTVWLWDSFSSDAPPAFQNVDQTSTIEPGLARDIEASPFGRGAYVLDGYGVVHSVGGARPLPVSSMTTPIASDMEFLDSDTLPNWNTTGDRSSVRIEPEQIRVDPDGVARRISLVLDNVERIWGFDIELHYDPERIQINRNQIRVGEWWQQSASSTRLITSVDERRGVCSILGSGLFAMLQSASGGGEIATLMLSSVDGIQSGTSTITIEKAILNYAFPDQPRSAEMIYSSTVTIETIEPEYSLGWNNSVNENKVLRTGDIFEVSMSVTHGSRLSGIEFSFSFEPEQIRFLGNIPGSAWGSSTDSISTFGTVSEANADGGLSAQQIRSMEPSTLPDETVALVSFFFEAIGEGKTVLTIERIAGLYETSSTEAYAHPDKSLSLPLSITRAAQPTPTRQNPK